MYVFIHACLCLCKYGWVHLCVCLYAFICVELCTFVCVPLCMSMFTHVRGELFIDETAKETIFPSKNVSPFGKCLLGRLHGWLLQLKKIFLASSLVFTILCITNVEKRCSNIPTYLPTNEFVLIYIYFLTNPISIGMSS